MTAIREPQSKKATRSQTQEIFLDLIASTSLNRRSENVVVEAIVIPKLELCNVKWRYLALTLWKEPTMPRLKMLQKPSPQDEVWACRSTPPAITASRYAGIRPKALPRFNRPTRLPDGQITCASGKSKSSPFWKNILIFRSRKSVYIHGHPASTRGALRGRHGRWMGDAMDVAAPRAILARTNGADRTAKSCGPDASTLASNFAEVSAR